MATDSIEGTTEFLNADRVTKLLNRYSMTTFPRAGGVGVIVFDSVTGKTWMSDEADPRNLVSCRFPGNSALPKSA